MSIDDTTSPGEDTEPDPETQHPGAGSGRGGDLGTPGGLPDEEPPSTEQEANEAVSGGGMVQPTTEGEPKDVVDKDDSR